MRTTKYLGYFTLLASLLLFRIDVAIAWGYEGHHIVGYIAESQLTPSARDRVYKLTGGVGLARVSTYMDEDKRDLGPQVRKWHYEAVPVCDTKPDEKYCREGNCVSRQIERLIGVLQSPDSNNPQKRQAVIYLTHLIGDIHQPLHTSSNGDKGGNHLKIISKRGWLSFQKKNLHEEWDTVFVKSVTHGRSEEKYASVLMEQMRGRVAEFQHGTAADWFLESHQIARDVAYGQLPGFACDKPMQTTKIAPIYADQARSVIQEQLFKAGVRLAWVFNMAFDESSANRNSH